MSSTPVVPYEIDWLRQLLEFAGEPVAISISRTVKAGRDCGAKSGWRQTNNVIVAQMRDEIVPDRLRFGVSVNKNNGHPSFSPKKKSNNRSLESTAAGKENISLALRHDSPRRLDPCGAPPARRQP